MKMYVKNSFQLKNFREWKEVFPKFSNENVRKGLLYLIQDKDKIQAIKALRQIYSGDNLSLLDAKLFVEWCQSSPEDQREYSRIFQEVVHIEAYSREGSMISIPNQHWDGLVIIEKLFECSREELIKKSLMKSFIKSVLNVDDDMVDDIYYSLAVHGLEIIDAAELDEDE